jgi:hypothetical protein
VQRNWKSLLGGCITVALAIAGVYLSGLYGKVTLKYTRWTQHNDFRDGCITDRDHNLTLAEECFAELARPRVSAVNMKRHIEMIQHACVDDALYWAVTICIPVLTYVFYRVCMRSFARDAPRPVVSLVKMDFSNFGQGQHGNGDAMITQTYETLSDAIHDRDLKVYDPLQQAQVGTPPSDSGSDEDYFQVWKDGIKSHREDEQASESDTEKIHPYRPSRANGSTEALFSDSRWASVSSFKFAFGAERKNVAAEEYLRLTSFEAELEPSMNRIKCQHIGYDGSASEFQPTDGILLEVWRNAEDRAESILKLPFERGATALELREIPRPSATLATPSWPLKFPKRATWARRLGLPSHRFVYIVVRDRYRPDTQFPSTLDLKQRHAKSFKVKAGL